jgi:raffinose/stachyose/melibiose transport system permease protein
MLLLLTIMIPGEVMLIGRYELMFELRLYDKIAGLLIAYTAGSLLLVIFIMKNVFASIPQDLIDAAMIDGASTWQVFWEIMVPIGRNGLAACGILTFLDIWNEFLFALTFTSMDKVRTLPVGIVMLKSQWGIFDSGVLFATVLLSFLPIIIVFMLLQKYFVRGLSTGALKV